MALLCGQERTCQDAEPVTAYSMTDICSQPKPGIPALDLYCMLSQIYLLK